MFDVKNLSLSIDGHSIFSDVTFSAKSGNVTLISGKSGSGKSSLLQVIARIIPNAYHGDVGGTISYKNEDLMPLSMSEIAGKIGYLMQDPESQICSFYTFDELIFGPENFNKTKAEMDSIVASLTEDFDLANLIDTETNQLSGGQKQRLALASVVAINPDIYLLDEPTANLDPKTTAQMIEIIDYLAHKRGKTVIVVEHKLTEIAHIVDRIYDMDHHQMIEDYIEKKLLNLSEEQRLPEISHEKSDKVLLEVNNLHFSYGPNEIIKEAHFEINKGEIVGLVGKNGAGKSTLANIISGFTPIQTGDVKIEGVSIKDLKLNDIGKKVGLVFQNPEHQFVKLTVEDEIKTSLIHKGLSAKEIELETEDYLKRFDLYDLKEQNPFQLSQGQKRKLSTAVMLMQNQSCLILDEPTYGQDPTNLYYLMELLIDISREGVGMLMITHDINVLRQCCHSVVEIRQGRTIKYENPETYLKRMRETYENL